MNRSEFLQKAGAGALFAVTFSCLAACQADQVVPITGLDLSLDLALPDYAALQHAEGYVIVENRVVVAKTADGEYIAATHQCSHEPRNTVIFEAETYYCTTHGARFNQSGKGLNSKGINGLQTFNTNLSGNILRVFS